MLQPSAIAARFRVLVSRALAFVGFRDDAFLLIVACIVGIVTAAAAVGFHELINAIRNLLYSRMNPNLLYGPAIALIILWPALGGLLVGFISNIIVRDRAGAELLMFWNPSFAPVAL